MEEGGPRAVRGERGIFGLANKNGTYGCRFASTYQPKTQAAAVAFTFNRQACSRGSV